MSLPTTPTNLNQETPLVSPRLGGMDVFGSPGAKSNAENDDFDYDNFSFKPPKVDDDIFGLPKLSAVQPEPSDIVHPAYLHAEPKEDEFNVVYKNYDENNKQLVEDIEAGKEAGSSIDVVYDNKSQIVDLLSLMRELDKLNPNVIKKNQLDEKYLRDNKTAVAAMLKGKASDGDFEWPTPDHSKFDPVAHNGIIDIPAYNQFFFTREDKEKPSTDSYDAFGLLGTPTVTKSGRTVTLQWPGKKPLKITLTQQYRDLLMRNNIDLQNLSPTVEPVSKRRKTTEQAVPQSINVPPPSNVSTSTNDVSTSMKQIAAQGPKDLSPTNTEIRDDYMALREANIARNNAVLAQLGLTKIPMGNNKPKETKKPAKKSKQDDDYDDEEEESDEDDEDFESDDDDDNDEKVSKATRSKKPKEKKPKATPAASEDLLSNIALDDVAKKLIADFLNANNVPTLAFSNLATAVQSVVRPVVSQAVPVSSAQLAAQNASTASTASTANVSKTTIADESGASKTLPLNTATASLAVLPKKKPTKKPANAIGFINMTDRERQLSICEKESDVSIRRTAERLMIPLINSRMQMKSKRQLCAEIIAKQDIQE